ASGSLNETDSTRGLAHYLEHMAFNGSANFAPRSVVPFFQSLGLAFGRDQNAFTSFEQTTYQLTLPGGGRDVVEKGLLFMSDVAMRMSLDAPEIDGQRQIILEEKRARASAQQRVQDQAYQRLAPESTPGRRPPIGPVTTVSQKRRDLVETIGTWAFNRRVSAELAAGNASFLEAKASVEEWPGTMRLITVETSCRPGTSRAMLKDLGTHLQRARL